MLVDLLKSNAGHFAVPQPNLIDHIGGNGRFTRDAEFRMSMLFQKLENLLGGSDRDSTSIG